MRIKSRPIAILIVGVFCATIATAQVEPKYEELPNFHAVNTLIYRGGQPKPGGIKKLVELGIKTVINLRDDDERARLEEQEVKAAGLVYYNRPLPRLDRPDDKQINELLILLTNSDKPVFVHCKRGSDRTGVLIAIYRIEHSGWTSDQAKSEANRYGMGFWQRRKKDYIHDYYVRRQKRNNSRSDATDENHHP
jgi:tyrosine-protein phosphatase SIW14